MNEMNAIIGTILGIALIIVLIGFMLQVVVVQNNTLQTTPGSNSFIVGGQNATTIYHGIIGNISLLDVIVAIVILLAIVSVLFFGLKLLFKSGGQGGGGFMSGEGN
jgi:hypothetical protein